MSILSPVLKTAGKALAKQAPDIATKAVKKSDWSWMYKGLKKKEALAFDEVAKRHNIDVGDPDFAVDGLSESVKTSFDNASGGDFSALKFNDRVERLDNLMSDGLILDDVIDEHAALTVPPPRDPVEALRANYAPREPEEAIANLQAAGADRLTGRKTTPRTIQGPVPPRLADKTFGQDAQSYEEAVMLGTTKFTEDGEAKMIRNYGSDTAPHGRVTKVDVRKMSGRGTEARITWEKLLTLDKNAKGFYGVKLKGKEHAHHWNPIGVMKRVAEGLDPKVRNQLIAEAQDEFGLYSGNTLFNLRQLPTDIHDKVHKALNKAGYDPKKMQSFAKADYATRKEFLKEFARVLSEIDEQLFQEVMKKTHGENWVSKFKGLDVPKKAEPNWTGIAKKAIDGQIGKSGWDEARWRSANTQFTWSKADNRGYIDIIKDATGDDAVRTLKAQFFKEIDKLPSGTTWTLEADTAQKYRIYKRMFRDDPRIKPGGDKKLLEARGIDHFVLTIP